jgi:hypothetical protein
VIEDAKNWRVHTADVLDTLQTAVDAMPNEETGVRSYLITGEDRFLEFYHMRLIYRSRRTSSAFGKYVLAHESYAVSRSPASLVFDGIDRSNNRDDSASRGASHPDRFSEGTAMKPLRPKGTGHT